MSPRSLQDLQKELDLLLRRQETTVGEYRKNKLGKKIKEVREKIVELRTRPTAPGAYRSLTGQGGYRCMAAHPDGFVERHQLDEIADLLTAEDTGVVGITTALRGAGGFGKTTLAQALAEDDRVRRAYPNGVLWTTMGDGLRDAERVSRVLDVIRFWDPDEKPVFDTVAAAGAHLRGRLAGKKVLLVVDDVWSSADVEPFRALGAGSALLITTRNRQTLPAECRRVDVDAMRRDEAVELLTSGLDDADAVLLADLTERLGKWPLLLKLVNRQLRGDVDYGLAVPAAIGKVEALLARGVDRLDVRQDVKREEAVRLTIQVSLDSLSDDDRRRYLELAVFPEDADVPLDAVARLWQLDAVETEELSRRLADLSLLLRLDLSASTLRLHGVFREYLLAQQDDLAGLHRTFLERCRPPRERWKDLAVDDAYVWRHLAYHLEKAEEATTLRELLFDFDYLHAKLAAIDVKALIADYDGFEDDREARSVQGALRLSAHVLVRDVGHMIDQQLAGQLCGRLIGSDGQDVRRLSQESARRIVLRPRTASLAQAGGPLFRTLEGHRGSVNAVALLDDYHVVSASFDQILRVWNIAAGDTIQSLEGHTSGLRAVAILDENRVVSASDDQTLRVWDVELGDTIRTLEGHTDWVRAVTVLDENRVVSASDDQTLRVWNITLGHTIQVLEGHASGVGAVAVLDENHVVSASLDHTLRIWAIESGATIQTLNGHKDGVIAVAVLDKGRVVSASFDQTLRVWDIASGDIIQTLEGHTSGVAAVAVLDKGRVVSGSFDHTLRIWDVASGESISVLKGHSSAVLAVAVLDENRIVSASLDQTLRVWDIASGRTVAIFTLEAGIWSVAFVPEQQIVVAGDGAGGVHFLDFVDIQSEEESEMGDRNVRIDGDAHGATIVTGDSNVVIQKNVSASKDATDESASSPVDAILITAITREREAALAELRARQLDPVLTEHGGRYHHAFELERGGKEALRCLLAQPSEKGPHATQALLSDLLRIFEPALVLLVGVAGGLDERGVGEGDVVVARRVYNYEPGRLKAGGIEERPATYSASARVIDLANALDADGAFADVLGGRRLHVRDYASGEKVLMDRGSELRRRILELSPDVYAFEMEGHGLLHSVWEAARELNVQCGVVKSVSDFGDENMRDGKDERQRKAARRAVGVALELLRRF